MVALWLLFTSMLFVAEPLFLRRWLLSGAETRPKFAFALIERLHWTTLIGAMLGSHGVLLIG